jgi:RimJ/RimL family protein N-acetyltransferase
MAHPYWPLFDLVVRTPRLELRYPDDDLLVGMVDLLRDGIHDPATMPFSEPWTDAPLAELQRSSLQHTWRARAEHTPDDWRLNLLAVHDGRVVGMQGANGKDFARLRQAETGSWLGLAHQGQGLGKEMRAAILHLLFEGLGAERAISGAWHDNPSSQGVSASFGYLPNGEEVRLRRNQPDRMLHLVLPREVWEQHRRDDIEIEGLDACRDLLIGPTTSPTPSTRG